ALPISESNICLRKHCPIGMKCCVFRTAYSCAGEKGVHNQHAIETDKIKGIIHMKREIARKAAVAILVPVAISILVPLSMAAQQIDRTVLPVKEPTYPESTV